MTPHRVHVMHHFSATLRIRVLSFVQGQHNRQIAFPFGRCNDFPNRWSRVCVIMPRRSLPRMGATFHPQSRKHLPDTQERLVHAYGLYPFTDVPRQSFDAQVGVFW